MTTTQQLIEAAERAIGITVQRTQGGRCAHYADETGTWYWLTRADLRHAVACAGMDDAYSRWCSEISVREVRDPQAAGLTD